MTLKQDRVHFALVRNTVIKLRYGCCTKQGIYFRIFFLYRDRISFPQRLTYTQVLVDYV